MHYANRARNIHNAPTKNVDATAAELQRLNALTRILQCKLIKSRFQGSRAGEETMGNIDTELMERRDVEEYIRLIHQRASKMSNSGRSLPSLREMSDSGRYLPTLNTALEDPSTVCLAAIKRQLEKV
jgi:hypothetical protein